MAACGAPTGAATPATTSREAHAPPERAVNATGASLRVARMPAPAPMFADPDRAKKLAELVPKLEKRVDTFFANAKPPSLAVAMIVDGRVVMSRVLGTKDKATRAPATSHTLYRIGSITKTFTATAAIALRDAGALRFDDPAERYLPELAHVEYPFADAPRITLRHMLTHTSGFPRLGDFDYTRADVDVTEKEMLDSVEKTSLASAPGTRSVYSNFAMSLVGTIVGRASPDKTYRGAIARYVTTPLGMTSTTFEPKALKGADIAVGYKKHGDADPASLWRLGASEASGGLWSSIDDLAKYVAWNLAAWPARSDKDDGPVARASLREAHRPIARVGLTASVDDGHTKMNWDGVGLAWHATESCAYDRIVWHNGGIDGFSASLGFAPDRGFGFVVLSNALDTETDTLYGQLLDDVAASDALAPRVDQAAPELVEAVNRWGASLVTCDASIYDTMLTPSFRNAVPREQWQEICLRSGATLGTCTVATTKTVRGPRDADFTLKCAKGGTIRATASVVEQDGGVRFAGLLFATLHAPTPAMVKAAEETLKTNEPLRKTNGACKLAPGAAAALSDGGPSAATFALECEKTRDVVLSLELDGGGKVKSVTSRVEHAQRRCVDPPRPSSTNPALR